jgi:transcriptional regulator with XRE-family HTH domain
LKLRARRVPDWVVERWSGRVGAFFRRLRQMLGISLDALVPVSGITRQGWRKFELGSKRGPLFTTILRAAYALPQRSWSIVITPEVPRIQRSR